jgi:hypothetical protein
MLMKPEIKSLWILTKPNKKPQQHEMICPKRKKTVCWPCWQRFCRSWSLITGEHCYKCSSRKAQAFGEAKVKK